MKQDKLARKTLCNYAYKTFFEKSLLQSMGFQKEKLIGVEGHIVWPIDYIQTTLNSTIMQTGKRCKCQKRIDFDVQCGHELALVPKFDHMHYNHRWLNNTAFNMMKPSLAPQCKRNAIPTHM